jgi:hypothetical protein
MTTLVIVAAMDICYVGVLRPNFPKMDSSIHFQDFSRHLSHFSYFTQNYPQLPGAPTLLVSIITESFIRLANYGNRLAGPPGTRCALFWEPFSFEAARG